MWRFFLIPCLIIILSRSVQAIDFSLTNPTVSDTLITVEASISGTTSNYYLQGVLRSVGSSKYFGATANLSNNWIDYISSPEKEYITSNFYSAIIKDASWSAQLKMRYFVDDDNYLGPGNYELKFRRFTGNSTSPAGESNTLLVNLSASLPSPSPSPTPSLTPTPTPTPSPSPSPSPTPTPQPSLKPSPSPTSPVETLQGGGEGTVAGESTEIDLSAFGVSPSPTLQIVSSQAPTLNHSRAKTVLLIGSGLVFVALAGFFGYRRYLAIKRSDLLSE
ncbi:MAG: hypothetical protein V1487_03535 [bacterium]